MLGGASVSPGSERGSSAVTVACVVGKSLTERDSRWVHVLAGVEGGWC